MLEANALVVNGDVLSNQAPIQTPSSLDNSNSNEYQILLA